MSGLDRLRTRLEFYGGVEQENRMIKDKLSSLKKALLYSYQSQTVILSDGRAFRALLNPDKTKPDYDCKIISIPYEDICLGVYDAETQQINKELPQDKRGKGVVETKIKPGDTFHWKETGTDWIVYLQKLEEKAYFRAECYRCEESVEICGKQYPIYIRGPVETTTQWNLKKGNVWNDLNYSLIIYITKNEETLDYFRRFTDLSIDGKQWKVETVDPYSADGIIEICLREWYTNTTEQYQNEKLPPEFNKAEGSVYIEGKEIVDPYSFETYVIKGVFNGTWEIDSPKKAKIVEIKGNTVTIEILSGKSGNFKLIYNKEGEQIVLPIRIKSL